MADIHIHPKCLKFDRSGSINPRKGINMANNDRKYPLTLAGLYENTFSDKFVLNSMPIDQQRADEICAAIQACVGGRLEVREWGGTSKNGKALPQYKLEGLTAEMIEERKAFGAKQKASREAATAGDDAL